MMRIPIVARRLPDTRLSTNRMEYTDGHRRATIEYTGNDPESYHWRVELANDGMVVRVPRRRIAVKGALHWIRTGEWLYEGRQVRGE